ncbi:MAG TPA: SAM-dependent chlorinase/fluorinase [Rhodospirillales bacterium]
MIVLFTDFGLEGPYVGQIKAVLAREAPNVPVIDLFADAPGFDPKLSAYLLAAYADEFPAATVFLCVVDPGVGGDRAALIVEADRRVFVGPDNGIFEIVRRRAKRSRCFEIAWEPERLSASFHGRDLFAPIAARLARGDTPPRTLRSDEKRIGADWPDDLPQIVYIDHFGNAMTGLRASALAASAELEAGGRRLPRRRTFGDVKEGDAFWYENANGLAEIAVNRGRADAALGLGLGAPVRVAAAKPRS